MEDTRLGSSGLKVSRIALGCMSSATRIAASASGRCAKRRHSRSTTTPTSRSSRPCRDRGARDVPMAHVAIAWVPRNPVVSAPIVGATKPHQPTAF